MTRFNEKQKLFAVGGIALGVCAIACGGVYWAQGLIEELVPVTMRLEAAHPEMLRSRRADWVLKSDYGAEGDEVVIGAHVTDEVWSESLAHARRGRWVAQRWFEAERDAQGRTTNMGVFLVAGEPAGLYARRGLPGTDATALSTPVLLRPGE